MKLLVYTYLLFMIFSCSSSKGFTQDGNIDSKYRIKKIKTKNSWYIIYAEKQDSLYKIVVGKPNTINDDCKKIVVGKYYDLELKSRRDNTPEINGVKLKPVNYLDVECYSYDEDTEICIEPKKGINDLYYTDDLKGLCYLK
ncbi:hypothetical protein [Algoriphagus marincola]|uniref:hypothetical protein n=1 Tax=Algoriphagus marincola TaxID=264027 RepID=UPI0012DC44C1|nr:hypothetical protein [Algoriphagus marincola]